MNSNATVDAAPTFFGNPVPDHLWLVSDEHSGEVQWTIYPDEFEDSEFRKVGYVRAALAASDGAKDREIAELLREETRERVGLQLANAKLRKALAGLLYATEQHVFGDECLAEREEARTTLEGGPA
jgi:hypothetical protein